MTKLQRYILYAVAGIVCLVVIAEVGLRVFFGLGSPPLVYANAKYGYAFVPNQSLKRFGNRISYNEAGLRSEGLRPLSGSAYRILCVGGSVTNGGALIDQQDTYPYQLEAVLNGKGQSVQVLNASAVGWDFANEYGYLRDKNIFDARVVVLEVGTRQLYQRSVSTSAAGVDPNLPEHNPSTAVGELIGRYLVPRVLRRLGVSSVEAQSTWTDDLLTKENYQRGLETLKEMASLVMRLGAKPILLETPDKDEAVPGRYRGEYQNDLSDLAAGANGRLVDMMPEWHAALSSGHDLFRDLINPNPDGDRALAAAVAAAVLQ